MSINQIRNATQARDKGRRQSTSCYEAVSNNKILQEEHPESVEAIFLANMPDDQDRSVSIHALAAAIIEDPENSVLLDQDPYDFDDRHEKNVSSFDRDIVLYESTLEDAAEVRLNFPTLEEDNRLMRTTFQGYEAQLQEYMAKHQAELQAFMANHREKLASFDVLQAGMDASNGSLVKHRKKVVYVDGLVVRRKRECERNDVYLAATHELNVKCRKKDLPYGSRYCMEIKEVRHDMRLTAFTSIVSLDKDACLKRLKILFYKGYGTNTNFEKLWTYPPVGTSEEWNLRYGRVAGLFDARTADVAQLQDRLLDYLAFTVDERVTIRHNTRSNSKIDN